MFTDEYKTVEAEGEMVIEDSGCRLTAVVLFVDSGEKVQAAQERIFKKFPDAAEKISCYKIGLEPNIVVKSAGGDAEVEKALTDVFENEEITNVFLAVMREKIVTHAKTPSVLAYRDTASNAIRRARIVKRILYDTVRYKVNHSDLNSVSRYITDNRGKILQTIEGTISTVVVKIRRIQVDALTKGLADLTGGKVSLEKK
ncbi:hypothetical protein K1X84_00915 [bacterium]|nr:hypothetical protein [bacterium]